MRSCKVKLFISTQNIIKIDFIFIPKCKTSIPISTESIQQPIYSNYDFDQINVYFRSWNYYSQLNDDLLHTSNNKNTIQF